MNKNDEKSYVRNLAEKVSEIAKSRGNESIIKRWRDVNALRKPDRAPVLCRPGYVWRELLPDDELRCADPMLKQIENELRQVIIKHEIGDDSVVFDYTPVEAILDIDPPNIYGIGIDWHEAPVEGGAGSYAPVIKNCDDLDKLVMPVYSYNKKKTEERAEFINDVIGDILPPKIIVPIHEPATICSPAADLLGLTEMMLCMADEPELLHRLMAYLRDVALATMEQKARIDVFTPNTDDVMYMSDEIDPLPGTKAGLKNCFGAGNSQEFDQVSPAMWEEFLLEYQKPIYERFGLAAYGCCENLSNKIDGVLSIPNLRIFVCSAWTDLDKVINKVEDKYAIMWRQKASDICFADDITVIKKHLESGCERMRGGFYQIVQRELYTLNGNLDRLHIWAELAKDAAAKYA